jgi:anti-anti-sigma regulatory factor
MIAAGFLFVVRMSKMLSIDPEVLSGPTTGHHDTAAEVREESDLDRDNILAFRIDGPVFFGAAAQFFDQVLKETSGIKVVILRMRRVPVMDATGLTALRGLVEALERKHIVVMVSGLQPQPREMLERTGVLDLICRNREHLFATSEEAIAHAREHLGRRIIGRGGDFRSVSGVWCLVSGVWCLFLFFGRAPQSLEHAAAALALGTTATGSRRHSGGKSHRVFAQRLAEHLLEPAPGHGAVAPLRPGICGGHGDDATRRSRPEPRQQPAAELVAQGGARRRIPPQLDPGGRPVGVLATRSTGGVETPLQFVGWDGEPLTDPEGMGGHHMTGSPATSVTAAMVDFMVPPCLPLILVRWRR